MSRGLQTSSVGLMLFGFAIECLGNLSQARWKAVRRRKASASEAWPRVTTWLNWRRFWSVRHCLTRSNWTSLTCCRQGTKWGAIQCMPSTTSTDCSPASIPLAASFAEQEKVLHGWTHGGGPLLLPLVRHEGALDEQSVLNLLVSADGFALKIAQFFATGLNDQSLLAQIGERVSVLRLEAKARNL